MLLSCAHQPAAVHPAGAQGVCICQNLPADICKACAWLNFYVTGALTAQWQGFNNKVRPHRPQPLVSLVPMPTPWNALEHKEFPSLN